MKNPAPRTMLLTGCASGIGRHLASVLAARGHRLLLTDIDEVGLKALVAAHNWSPEQVQIARLDVRDSQSWQAMIELAVQSFGRLDVLINIAGYLKPGYIHEIGPEQIDRHMDTNAKGVMYGTQAAAALMVRQKQGHIINIASLAGVAPIGGIGLYSASKFAVRGFSLAAAQELRPHGVYVTVVCPDAVQTPMLDLQLDYKEAALTFSGAKALTVQDIERLIIEKVLPKKPLEVVYPWSRGGLAKLASFFPGLSHFLAPALTKIGLSRQARGRGKGRTED